MGFEVGQVPPLILWDRLVPLALNQLSVQNLQVKAVNLKGLVALILEELLGFLINEGHCLPVLLVGLNHNVVYSEDLQPLLVLQNVIFQTINHNYLFVHLKHEQFRLL